MGFNFFPSCGPHDKFPKKKRNETKKAAASIVANNLPYLILAEE
jgi:hypothetical protein